MLTRVCCHVLSIQALAIENGRKGIKPVVSAAQKAQAAKDKKHALRKKENYKRITDDSLYVRSTAAQHTAYTACICELYVDVLHV